MHICKGNSDINNEWMAELRCLAHISALSLISQHTRAQTHSFFFFFFLSFFFLLFFFFRRVCAKFRKSAEQSSHYGFHSNKTKTNKQKSIHSRIMPNGRKKEREKMLRNLSIFQENIQAGPLVGTLEQLCSLTCHISPLLFPISAVTFFNFIWCHILILLYYFLHLFFSDVIVFFFTISCFYSSVCSA